MKILDNLTYVFSADNAPQAHAEDGEVLAFKTQDCFAGQICKESDRVDELDLTKANPTAGPLYIDGAEPGDVLAVDILDIQVGDRGFACSIPEVGALADQSEMRTRVLEIKDGLVHFQGMKWPVDPMVGVIGLAPAEGEIACGLIGPHGGNMDSKKICKGSRVYFPVRQPGGLLQMGDLHASMGDGEVSGTGIEIPGQVLVRVNLVKDFDLNWPVTETEDFWYVNAMGQDFPEAFLAASKELARLMEGAYPLDKTDAFIYLSLQGDVGVNQYVHPVDGEMPSVRFGIPKTSYAKPLIRKK